MKYLKMIGLAAVTAMAIAAFAGVSSASATTVCRTNTSPCTEPYSGSLKAKLEAGTEAELEAGPVSDKCTTSAMEGTTESNGEGKVTSLTFGVGGSCTCEKQVAVHLPFKGTADTATQTVTFSSSGAGNPGGEVVCAGLKCIFEETSVVGKFTGGSPAKLTVETGLKKGTGSGFLCPATATWKAHYVVTEPGSLFLK